MQAYISPACLNVVRHAPDLGAAVVTLCTGSRDPGNQWRAHPGNTSASAWEDLLETVHGLVPAAAAAGVKLGIEPEQGNVVRDADAARRLIEDLGDDADHIVMILDPANRRRPGHRPDLEAGDAQRVHRFLAEHADRAQPCASTSSTSFSWHSCCR